MTTDVRPVGAGLPALDDLSTGHVVGASVVSAVRQMYARHPFPPPQRKNSYRRHAACVRQFLHERGIVPEGSTLADIVNKTLDADRVGNARAYLQDITISPFAQKAQ